MRSQKDKKEFIVIDNIKFIQVVDDVDTNAKKRQAVLGLFFFVLGMLVMFRLFGHFAI